MQRNLTEIESYYKKGNLTEIESYYKKVFQRIVNNCDTRSCLMERFQHHFHLSMQNPKDGVIEFKGIDRGLLHNGLLAYLFNYFCVDGQHLFDKPVKQLTITGTCLSRLTCPMPDGTPYIAALIAKNPDIKIIDLSDTQLGDVQAQILIEALAKNTKLRELKLDGNQISPAVMEAIQKGFKTKNSHYEIRKNARVLAQACRTQTSFFSMLPHELTCYITTLTGNSQCQNSKESLDIVINNFCKPG